MPIEIRELVIKANITEPQGNAQPAPPAATSDASIQKIIDEVLAKIKNKNER